jgi:hypothetical protein
MIIKAMMTKMIRIQSSDIKSVGMTICRAVKFNKNSPLRLLGKHRYLLICYAQAVPTKRATGTIFLGGADSIHSQATSGSNPRP